MATADHPNVELVRRGFEAMAAGDIEGTLAMFSPDLRYYGGDGTGGSREFSSRDDFFGMVLELMAQNEVFTDELIDAYAVGDEIVMAHVRGHRQAPGQEPLLFDYVMAFRVHDGVVTHGVDVFDSDAEEYMVRATAARG